MYSIGDTLELSDGKVYVIASNAKSGGNYYYYIVDSENPFSVKFCLEIEEDGKSYLQECDEKDDILKIIPIFQKNCKKFLDKKKINA